MITAAAAARGVMAISTVTTLKAVNLRRRKTFLPTTDSILFKHLKPVILKSPSLIEKVFLEAKSSR